MRIKAPYVGIAPPGIARPLGPESLDSARDPELVEGLQPGITCRATLAAGP